MFCGIPAKHCHFDFAPQGEADRTVEQAEQS
jgi:hypothetical protein